MSEITRVLMDIRNGSNPYIGFGYPAKTDVGTILDDGIAGAAEIDVHIPAVVHAELAARDHNDAVINTSDVRRAVDLTADQKTFADTLDSQTGIRFSVGCGNRHVHDAVTQGGDGGRNSGG